MTWAEFKQEVERLGVVDNDPLAYIDWAWYQFGELGIFRFEEPDKRAGYVVIDNSGPMQTKEQQP